MALDGIAISNIIFELKETILSGRIDKIHQPENDEIVISVRSFRNTCKLLLTANSSHPRLHLTKQSKQNPITAPLFCMVLRKHLNNGKIVDITQPNFERIVQIHIESMNEMGDISTKRIVIEVMGKHSNIILIDDQDVILDSIKHISHEKSSIREVLPGKTYVFPPSDKLDPMLLEQSGFCSLVREKQSKHVQGILYQSYNGISPVMGSEICFRANVDASLRGEELSEESILSVYQAFEKTVEDVKNNQFKPAICYDEQGKVIDFFSVESFQHNRYKQVCFDSISDLLENFYQERDTTYRILQKTQDLRKLISQNIERCIKKHEMQLNTLVDIENRNDLKMYGDLITANAYAIEKGLTEVTLSNYYDPNFADITIRLDPTLTPIENAQTYFKKYNKQKRTFAALEIQMEQNQEEHKYLETILNSLLVSGEEADIEEIKEELQEQGFMKKKRSAKQKKKKTKPLFFRSSDGYEMYVGKNNKQNDELTLKFAKNCDIWLHTKDIAGSHVIIKTDGREEVPVSTLNEATHLAAYYSKARLSSSVPVDYTAKKNVKKPSGAKPGMVIYVNYHTAFVTPDEAIIKNLQALS